MAFRTAAPPRLAMNARRSISNGIKSLLAAATVGPHGKPVNKKRSPHRRVVSVYLASVLLAVVVMRPAADSNEPITERRVRALARLASRQSRGDPSELVLALDRL